MKINFKTVDIDGHTGYGNASRLLKKALEDRGCSIAPGSSTILNFNMPPKYEYGEYTIGYTPWESTEVPPGWSEGLAAVDYLWTPTKWVAEIFSQYRNDDIFVLPHGIEKCWTPSKRERGNGEFIFLHVGEPAERKGADILLKAWYKAFRHRTDMHLAFKCIGYPIARVKDRDGSIIASAESIPNVSWNGSVMSQSSMLNLYQRSHCMVYPTRGEGFGLIPFEAMATGLPTILPSQGGTRDFAHYSPLTLNNSTWVKSTEDRIHPGLWMDHDVDELIDWMLYVMDHYDTISEVAYQNAGRLHFDYSWERVADMAIDALKDVM